MNEAASKMIAVAMKERASMPEGRSILHDVCSNRNAHVNTALQLRVLSYSFCGYILRIFGVQVRWRRVILDEAHSIKVRHAAGLYEVLFATVFESISGATFCTWSV